MLRLYGQRLNFIRAGVRGFAENEYAAVGAVEEWGERVAPEVGVGGDGVRPQFVEGGTGIGFGSVGDVATLGVEDDGDAVGGVSDHVFERAPAVGAEAFEKGRVGFEGGGIRRGGVDEAEADAAGLGGGVHTRGEADTEEGVDLASAASQRFKKVHASSSRMVRWSSSRNIRRLLDYSTTRLLDYQALPNTSASSAIRT